MTPESIGLNQIQLNLTSRSGQKRRNIAWKRWAKATQIYVNMDHLYDAFLKLAGQKARFDYDPKRYVY